MLEGEREIDLEFSVARRSRVVGDHRRTALTARDCRGDQPGGDSDDITAARIQSARKPRVSGYSESFSDGWATPLAKALPPVRTAPRANKSGASSDRARLFSRCARSSAFALL